MNVSKEEQNKLRYTGIDVEKCLDEITVSMNDYVDSLNEVNDIRKAPGTTELSNWN